MKPDYQFDDGNKTLPLWKVKHEFASDRIARMPFFKRVSHIRAASRQEAINKVKSYFLNDDRFTASKIKDEN